MFQREITLNQFMLGYLDRLLEGLSDDDFTTPLAGGGHSPQWILGHLIMVADYAAIALGLEATADKSLRQTFGPGSGDTVHEGETFSRATLSQAIGPAYERLYDAANTADEADLQKPHGVKLVMDTPVETRAEFIAHILTTHIATHVGQLSAWRRAQGHDPLF